MCAPAAAPIAMGAAQFGVGALGAVGKHQQAQAQTRAANQAAINDYKYRNQLRAFEYLNSTTDYNYRASQFREQVGLNELAAQRGYEREQARLNELMQQQAFGQQSAAINLARTQGQFASTGRSGKSIDRIESNRLAEFGRQMAGMSAMRDAYFNRFDQNVSDIRQKTMSANRRAYGSLGITPKQTPAPQAPVMKPGPSGIGLATDLLGAGLSGVQTADSFTENGLFNQR